MPRMKRKVPVLTVLLAEPSTKYFGEMAKAKRWITKEQNEREREKKMPKNGTKVVGSVKYTVHGIAMVTQWQRRRVVESRANDTTTDNSEPESHTYTIDRHYISRSARQLIFD